MGVQVKLFIKLVLMLLIGAMFSLLWLRGPDGKSIMELEDLVGVPSDLVDAPARLIEQISSAADSALGNDLFPESQMTREPSSSGFYRWQDDRGVWHFSDTPPEGRVDLTAEILPELTNSIEAVEVAEEMDTGQSPPANSSMSPPVALPEGVSKEAIEEMLQDAHERRMGDHL